MVIKFFQLSKFLDKQLYFLNGDVTLAESAFKQIKAARKEYLQESYYLDQNFNWGNFLQQFWPSLDGVRKLIKWYWLDSPKQEIEENLVSFFEQLGEHIVIIFSELAYRKKTWWRTLDNKGIIVNLWPLTEEKAIEQWILQENEVPLTGEEVKLIIQFLGKDLCAIRQFLLKLKLMPTKINFKQLLTSLTASREYNLYDLLNAVWERKKDEVIKIYQTLEIKSILPLIIWGFTADLRSLWAIKTGQDSWANLKVHFTRHKALQNVMNWVSLEDIRAWWLATLRVEWQIKMGKNPEILSWLMEVVRGNNG